MTLRSLSASGLTAFFLLPLTLLAQVPHGGGAPFWNTPGTNMDNPAWPVHRMPGIDLEALRAGDAVTDLVKSAPWRFGQEFEVDLDLADGVWLLDGAGVRGRVPLVRETPAAGFRNVAAIGDFDGDGSAGELLLQIPATGDTELGRVRIVDGEARLETAPTGPDGSTLAEPIGP